jgi:hypothetical protein
MAFLDSPRPGVGILATHQNIKMYLSIIEPLLQIHMFKTQRPIMMQSHV